MKQLTPTAQEILNNKDTTNDATWARWVEWYNYRLKILREQANTINIKREEQQK